MTGVAKDTINDHTMSRRLGRVTTDEYEGSSPSLVTNKLNQVKMSKIKKVQEITDLSVYTSFTKDEGMFQIEAGVYSKVSTNLKSPTPKYNHDVTEVELRFLINGKKVTYTGFKTLYDQLYGENTFSKYWSGKCAEFEEAYYKQTTYKTK